MSAVSSACCCPPRSSPEQPSPISGNAVKKLLDGVVVYAANTNRVYIPQSAVDKIKHILSRM